MAKPLSAIKWKAGRRSIAKTYKPNYLRSYLSIYHPSDLSIYQSINVWTYHPDYQPRNVSMRLSCAISFYQTINIVDNDAIPPSYQIRPIQSIYRLIEILAARQTDRARRQQFDGLTGRLIDGQIDNAIRIQIEVRQFSRQIRTSVDWQVARSIERYVGRLIDIQIGRLVDFYTGQ